jgi:hypothetical protein
VRSATKQLVDLWTEVVGGDAELKGKILARSADLTVALDQTAADPVNSTVRKVGIAGEALMADFSSLRESAQHQTIPEGKIRPLNEANAVFTGALEKYSEFWKNTFKGVSDARQIRDIIRKKVSDLVIPSYKPLKDKLATLDKDLDANNRQRDELVAEYRLLSDPAGSDRKRAQAILAHLDSTESEITHLKGQKDQIKQKAQPLQTRLAAVGLSD